nr:histidinol-phosphate transaminase [uncultured Methanofollis sp.]
MSGTYPRRVEHGGRLRWHRRHSERDILDFSASINPFPPDVPFSSPGEVIASYPDDGYESLKEAIGRVFHRDPTEITVGNGSVEVIRAFCAAAIRPGESGAVTPPTFGEYEMAVRLCGGRVTDDATGAAVRFLCNPNNPDGALTRREDVLAALDTLEDCQRLFVDEAFIELADPTASVSDVRDPALFVSRSITKSFAVPGLRFGFGFGDPDLVAGIEARRLPWTVNAYAESFALAALERYADLGESRRRIAIERAWLAGRLRDLGLSPLPSSANYLLVPLPCPAPALTERLLLSHDILVRDCTSFGLPDMIRVAVRRRDENTRLVEALAACLP